MTVLIVGTLWPPIVLGSHETLWGLRRTQARTRTRRASGGQTEVR